MKKALIAAVAALSAAAWTASPALAQHHHDGGGDSHGGQHQDNNSGGGNTVIPGTQAGPSGSAPPASAGSNGYPVGLSRDSSGGYALTPGMFIGVYQSLASRNGNEVISADQY